MSGQRHGKLGKIWENAKLFILKGNITDCRALRCIRILLSLETACMHTEQAIKNANYVIVYY